MRSKRKKRRITLGYDEKAPVILHVSTALSWRGGEQQLAYLFAELDEKGVQQSIVCPEKSPLDLHCKKEEWPKENFRKRGGIDIFLARRIKKVARYLGADIVHTHDSHAHTAALLANILFRMKIPVVVHRRVDFPVGSSFLSRSKYDHPSIAKVICVSEAIKRIGTENLSHPEKWVVVHSGIDLDRFRDVEATKYLRSTYDIPPKKPLIGNVSALADHKDHFTFIDTAEEFFKKGNTGTFLIIGEGKMREELQDRVRSKGLEEKVILTGFLKNIPAILQELDIFLMTSKTEGLGTTLLDALASGLPIVSTDAGGIPEMIKDGENGYIAPIGDHKALSEKVEALLADSEKREKFSKKGLETAKGFSKKKMADKVLEIYLETLK